MPSPLTLDLHETALRALDQLVESTGNSRDSLVARAIEIYAAQNDWQLDKIGAGIVAGDQADFASEDDLRRVKLSYSQPA